MDNLISFLVPALRTVPVHIYEPIAAFGSEKPRYFAPAYYAELPPSVRNKVILLKGGYAAARSIKRPEVIPGTMAPRGIDRDGVEWLIRALARLDARNMPRDSIFDSHVLFCRANVVAIPESFPEQIREQHPNAEYFLTLLSVEFRS